MMDNAMLIGLSRQMTLRRHMDVIANNLANLNTAGFRSEALVFEEYLMPDAEVGEGRIRDRTVSYVIDRMSAHDMSPGALKATGNALDVAIEGDAWLVVQTPDGERFTRAGALRLNENGEMANADGFPVLGDAGPIVIGEDDSEIVIAADGTVSSSQGDLGRLRLAAFDNPRLLKAEGSGLFSSQEPPAAAQGARFVQGMIEGSNVRPIAEMSRMIEVTRQYTSLARIMERSDEMRRQAIGTLGRVE